MDGMHGAEQKYDFRVAVFCRHLDDAKAPIVLREVFDAAVARAAPCAAVLDYRSGRPKGRSVVVGEVMCLSVTLHIGGFGSDEMDLAVSGLANTIAHDL